MPFVVEYITPNADNTIDLQLLTKNANVELASVTNMVLTIGTTVIDSTTSAAAFNWDSGNGILHLKLGSETLPPPGGYISSLQVTDLTGIYSWGNLLIVVNPKPTQHITTGSILHDHIVRLGKTINHFDQQASLLNHLVTGLQLLAEKKPLIKETTIDLISGQETYELPDDFFKPHIYNWKTQDAAWIPWNKINSNKKPYTLIVQGEGKKNLKLSKKPTTANINTWGSLNLLYKADYVLGLNPNDSNVLPNNYQLLMTAILLAALRELCTFNITEPVQLHRGLSSIPTQSTPLALYTALDKQWRML